MEIITSHISTDFDGLASMVAAQKLNPQAKLYFPGTPEKGVRNFLHLYKDFFKVEIPKNIDKLNIKKLIIVDCRNPNRLANFRNFVNNPQIEVHVYDHHPPSLEDIKGDVNIIENVGSTVTILMKKIIEKNIKLTPLEATLMTLGIYEETGSLLFPSTTPDDAKIVANLLTRGVNLSVVADFFFHKLDEEQHKILYQLLSSSYILKIKGFKILIARAKVDKFIDGLALITHRLQDLERMDAIFSLVEMKDRIYIVARSIRPAIDVNRIVSFFEGGGHENAASAVVKNISTEEVELKLKKVLKRFVQPRIKAGDIMSKPVQTLEIAEGMTLNDAYDYMYKIGHFNLPVTKNKKLIGIVNSRDMEKANRHGYGNAPLKVYMSSPVITARVDNSIFQLQSILMEKGIGCLPITDNGNLVGIVSRSDVLEAIYRRNLSIAKKRQNRPLNQLKNLPFYLRNILKIAGKIGDDLSMGVYVVGGFVRDLLLNKENLDIDLVVEGDGMQFGELLSNTFEGRIKIHEHFGTSIVILPDGMHIDVATSRTEFYTRPAALPEVMVSSIKQDLYRRDFTINAMAIRLNRQYFGELMDFFGSRKDLRNKIIRVLHPMSFIDDPTRIFRAIKFEQRYQFRMDQSTENFLKDALYKNIFKIVSPIRLRTELIEILEEARPLPAIKRMNQLKVLRIIHPDIHLNSHMIEVFKSISATLLQFNELVIKEGVKSWILYFNVLVMQLQPSEIKEIGDKFKVPDDIIKRISFDRNRVHKILRLLSTRRLKNSEIFRALEGLSLETILFLVARTSFRMVRSRITSYLNKLRHIKPIITGKELKTWNVPQGPIYKKILNIMFDAQINGIFNSKEGGKELFDTRLKALF